MRKYLCYLFQKESFTWPLVHLKKTASFRTQLSTYSRRFITSVEHENSGEHEISDLSTDLSLSSSTVYNLGPGRVTCPPPGLSEASGWRPESSAPTDLAFMVS